MFPSKIFFYLYMSLFEILSEKCNAHIPKIINGTVANRTSFPFAVQLYTSKWSFECTGSLITTGYVLSAGHCFVYGKASWVVAGDTYLTRSDWPYRQVRHIIKSIVHPAFKRDTNSLTYDLALVLLNESLELSDYVKQISLCTASPKINEICTNAGWGGTKLVPKAQSTPSTVLRYHYVKVMDHFVCPKKFWAIYLVCGYSPTSTAYYGDSGGPLICKNKLCGVLSAYHQSFKLVNLFANVERNLIWIESNGTTGTSSHTFNSSLYSFALKFLWYYFAFLWA